MHYTATKTNNNFSPFRGGAKAPSPCFCGHSGDASSVANALEKMICRHIECVDYKRMWDIGELLEPLHNQGEQAETFQYFYHPDHLGSSSFITNMYGYAEQHIQYLPFGELFVNQQNTSFDTRYKFTTKEHDQESNYTYFGARYYDSDLSVWLNVDPMADQRSWVSPYSYCQNNPVMRVDPMGALDAPIYDTEGNFLGTDDQGLQGKAIVMNKEDFTQGMFHNDALSKNLGVDGLSGDGAKTNLLSHYRGLSSRPDYDGVMSYSDLLDWGRKNGNSPVFLDASKIDLGNISIDDFSGVGDGKRINTVGRGTPLDTYGPWGKNYMRLMSADGLVKLSSDEFDYRQHDLGKAWNEGFGTFMYETLIRYPAIGLLQMVHGVDNNFGFMMHPYGKAKLHKKVPYTGPGSGANLLKSMDWKNYR